MFTTYKDLNIGNLDKGMCVISIIEAPEECYGETR